MNLPRISRHIVIIGFLVVTCAAFLLTVFRIWLPLPRTLLLFSYGMMAPYQGYERMNADLRAEGQDQEGVWQPIDLSPYFPVIRGEEHIRKYYMIFGYKHPAFAKKLLMVERQKGNDITAVRLYWDQWQPSPLGYEALRNSSGSYKDLLTTVHE